MGIKLHRGTDHIFLFQCPGCDCLHYADERWQWNGSLDKPTFTPSIVVEGCHSFVTDGKIRYLSDCTHQLAGREIELPDWDD